MTKKKRYLTLGLAFMLAAHFVLFAQQPSNAPTSPTTSVIDAGHEMDDLKSGIQKKNKPPETIREGTVLRDQPGEFRLVGNRVLLLIHDGNRQFYCLENINLERVVQVLRDNPQTVNRWNVDFMVTEYQNKNYALIHRAVLQPRSVSSPTSSTPLNSSSKPRFSP